MEKDCNNYGENMDGNNYGQKKENTKRIEISMEHKYQIYAEKTETTMEHT